jgi:hypothetical protein
MPEGSMQKLIRLSNIEAMLSEQNTRAQMD